MAKSAQSVLYLTADTTGTAGVRYNKQLWVEQVFPDNYTDETFLQSLKVKLHKPVRSYWQVVLDGSAVTQQMDTVVAVVAVSAYLYKASKPAAYAYV